MTARAYVWVVKVILRVESFIISCMSQLLEVQTMLHIPSCQQGRGAWFHTSFPPPAGSLGVNEISTVSHWKCAKRLFAHGTGYTETPVVMPRLIIHQQVLPNVSHLLAIF